MFVDRVKIYVKAGNGGNGCVSFHREKYIPKGGPNGGNGGHGGSVIFVADSSTTSLADLKFNQHQEAKHGLNGMGKDQNGTRGDDLIVHVPPGTVVMDINNDNYEICDLDELGARVVIAEGGSGGRGNRSFATARNRVPRNAEQGVPGEELTLLLELKIIADIGLVGYPNAGKSTFLNAVSNSGAKTASYPFTTLHPIVGTVDFEDYSRMTIADIPGLVEGAHENVGLGHHFLRHIERTKTLAYVLDMNGTDGRDPLDDLIKLQEELDHYQEGLQERARFILANKMDTDEAAENLERLRKATDLPIFPMSAELKEGVPKILEEMHRVVLEVRSTTKLEDFVLKDVHSNKGEVIVDLEADGDIFGDEFNEEDYEISEHDGLEEDSFDDIYDEDDQDEWND
jgi:GTPase